VTLWWIALKVLDLERPIREADINRHWRGIDQKRLTHATSDLGEAMGYACPDTLAINALQHEAR
jgi:hypothetical protein